MASTPRTNASSQRSLPSAASARATAPAGSRSAAAWPGSAPRPRRIV
ncbi:hypothetical protein [Spongiactinospora sp. TRM90649]|nr:hypothetical protein [Spongiactinospora sp. TRM90649]MDF5752630.1 hypothetical protein [Spongiactinospora sp. TRM90649]